MPVLDIQAIEKILPHRYPFLLIDRIIELEDMRVVGIKNVTMNEPHFTGHFPGMPVMPGVLIIEAMAQTAAVLVLSRVPDPKTKSSSSQASPKPSSASRLCLEINFA